MKKNLKLFSTIASLCLAVALMAFGVWAAQSKTLGVSGQISFTSTDINGYWSFVATVEGGKFDGKTGGESTTLSFANSSKSGAYTESLPNVIVTTTGDNKIATLRIVATFHNEADTVTANLTVANNSPEDTQMTVTPGSVATATAKATGTIESTVKFEATNLWTNATVNYSLAYTAQRAS